MTVSTFTSNIQKGGALLDDSRRLVEVWDTSLPVEDNLRRISEGNLLGKPSRSRSDDVLLRILRPRLVDSGPHVIAALKQLVHNPRAFAEACYYESTRDDVLLAAFVEEQLTSWYEAGRVTVDVRLVVEWLRRQEKQGRAPAWSDQIALRVARGLLAALRDFGILVGTRARKEIAPPTITMPGFAFVAFRLHEQGASSRALVESSVWRRWLLDSNRVVELFRRADQLGVLRYAEAGTVVRVDWLAGSLQEVIRAAA